MATILYPNRIFFAATKENKNFKSSETYSEESIWINKATRVRVVTVKSSETYSEESIWINKATRVRVVTVNQM